MSDACAGRLYYATERHRCKAKGARRHANRAQNTVVLATLHWIQCGECATHMLSQSGKGGIGDG